jgi:hypothetical protein
MAKKPAGTIPSKQGLTAEAMQALQEQALLIDDNDTGTVLEEDNPNPFDVPITQPLFAEEEVGDSIDDSRLHQQAEEPPPAREAKASIPSIDEWQDFWSRIALRVACDYYIDMAFKDVDENLINDRDIERIRLRDDERKRIATPLAEFSHKSKFMRKHGRTIVASGGMFDALVTLGQWTSRVNRVARKYKPKTVKGNIVNERFSASPQAGTGDRSQGANGGTVPGDWIIVNPGG